MSIQNIPNPLLRRTVLIAYMPVSPVPVLAVLLWRLAKDFVGAYRGLPEEFGRAWKGPRA